MTSDQKPYLLSDQFVQQLRELINKENLKHTDLAAGQNPLVPDSPDIYIAKAPNDIPEYVPGEPIPSELCDIYKIEGDDSEGRDLTQIGNGLPQFRKRVFNYSRTGIPKNDYFLVVRNKSGCWIAQSPGYGEMILFQLLDPYDGGGWVADVLYSSCGTYIPGPVVVYDRAEAFFDGDEEDLKGSRGFAVRMKELDSEDDSEESEEESVANCSWVVINLFPDAASSGSSGQSVQSGSAGSSHGSSYKESQHSSAGHSAGSSDGKSDDKSSVDGSGGSGGSGGSIGSGGGSGGSVGSGHGSGGSAGSGGSGGSGGQGSDGSGGGSGDGSGGSGGSGASGGSIGSGVSIGSGESAIPSHGSGSIGSHGSAHSEDSGHGSGHGSGGHGSGGHGSGGSEGSGSGDSEGSGKSSAIVPASWTHGGYTALFVTESPEVWFEDIFSAEISTRESRIPIDPKFVEVCEPGTRFRVWCQPDAPVLCGAKVIDNEIHLTLDRSPDEPVVVDFLVRGIRKGFGGVRFPNRTREQFLANERFIKSAYPGA